MRIGRAFNTQHHLLVAAELGGRLTDELAAPAAALRIAGVHAQQVAGEQGRLVAAGTSANFHEGRPGIVWVLGHQHELQGLVQMGDIGLRSGDFFFSQLAHFGLGQQGLCLRQVVFALAQAPVLGAERADFGMFAGELAKAVHVADHIGGRQQRVELIEAQQLAL